LVEEQRRAGVAEVVAAEVGEAGFLERGDPDASPPVLATEVAARTVGKDERVARGPSLGEGGCGECAVDGREQLGLACMLRLRRRYLLARVGAVHAQALARPAVVVEHVAPAERVGLARAEAFVGEDADQRRVLRNARLRRPPDPRRAR